MLQAHLENKLIPPTKNSIAQCPLCSSKVVAKCGEINIHHWAHIKNGGCDIWSEPETYWHKSWKESFPIANREVVIEKWGKKHFADLFTNEKIVIELQNSSISSETIREREIFYGNNLLWVINGGRFRDHISFYTNEEIRNIRIKKNLDSYYGEIFLSDDNINEYLSTSKEFNFSWRHPIRSWVNSKRPVFLDINEDFMLWFTKGIGTGYGSFKVYPKQNFFKKYNGDYSQYQKLNKQDEILRYKAFVKIIYDECWGFRHELDTYTYPPFLSLKVYSNLTKKTCLHKVRWQELLIPNGNSKGIYFLFCSNLENPDIIGLYADNTDEMSISRKILKIIEENNTEAFYYIDNVWRLDFIASIPLNKSDSKLLGRSLLNFYLEKIYQKTLNNKNMQVIQRFRI